jgi:hypothetical protein
MKTRLALIVAALVAAFAPLPAPAIERWYSTGFYPRLQAVVTPLTNLVPVALLDIAIGVLLVGGLAGLVRRWRVRGVRGALTAAAADLVTAAAVAYLAFLAMWGLNYRRVPLEQKLAYDEARVTREAARRMAADTVGYVNAGHAAAQAARADPAVLKEAFASTQRALGSERTAVPGIPKRSLIEAYFRHAAIDGMTDPYFHEIILNPDLLAVERPFVLAHEWAHLAGYAHESEANFVAWLSCIRADSPARYSGWLMAYQLASSALSREERRALPPLDRGPRDDLRAMAERYRRSSPAVREAARTAYDSYLRANRVAEGIESYDAVLRLMLGSRFDEPWIPRRR